MCNSHSLSYTDTHAVLYVVSHAQKSDSVLLSSLHNPTPHLHSRQAFSCALGICHFSMLPSHEA